MTRGQEPGRASPGVPAPIHIDLPWPDKALHPNARVHWARRAKAAKSLRTAAAACTLEAGIRRGDWDIPCAIRATVIFHPPDKRRRDIDGMLSSIKSGIDGIADILGIDDSRWTIAMCKGEPRKGGLVRVELEAA